MKKFVLSLLLLCSFQFCYAADDKYVVPEQKIVGAERPFAIGNVIDVSVSEIPADKKPKNLISHTIMWRVREVTTEKSEYKFLDVEFKKNPNGIYLGTGIENKKLFIEATVVYLYAEIDEATKKANSVGTQTRILSTEAIVGTGKFENVPPKPNPKPDPPKPEPIPPVPPVADKLFLIILNETSSVPLEYVNFLGDKAYFDKLRGAGHGVGLFDLSSPDTEKKNYRKEIEKYNASVDSSRKVSYPALLVLEKNSVDKERNGKVIVVENCPKETEKMDETVKRITGK